MSHSLGPAAFTFFDRNDQRGHGPDVLTEVKSILTRPGVDGVSVRFEGRKGVPFGMTSLRDVESADDAYVQLNLYKALEASVNPQVLIWNSINYATFGLKYVVLHAAQEYSIRPVKNVAGSARLTATPTFILVATWALIAVTTVEETET